MQLTNRFSIFIPFLLSLAACSGSDEEMGGLDDPETVAKIQDAKSLPAVQGLPGGVAILDVVLDAAAMPSAPAAARVGTASYSGSMLATNTEIAAKGDLALSANFDSGNLTGSVTNVTSHDVESGQIEELDGTLNITGTIDTDGLTANLNGSLTSEEYGTQGVSGQFEGDFRGADADVVAGVGELDVEGDGPMDAVFVADRID